MLTWQFVKCSIKKHVDFAACQSLVIKKIHVSALLSNNYQVFVTVFQQKSLSVG